MRGGLVGKLWCTSVRQVTGRVETDEVGGSGLWQRDDPAVGAEDKKYETNDFNRQQCHDEQTDPLATEKISAAMLWQQNGLNDLVGDIQWCFHQQALRIVPSEH